MPRRLFTVLAAASLLLCLAAAALSVRGCLAPETWVYHTQSAAGQALVTRSLTLDNQPGSIAVALATYEITLPSPALAAAYAAPLDDLTGRYPGRRNPLAVHRRRGTLLQRLGLDCRDDDGADNPPNRLFSYGLYLKATIQIQENLPEPPEPPESPEPAPSTQRYWMLRLPSPLAVILLAISPAIWLYLHRRRRRQHARALLAKWGV